MVKKVDILGVLYSIRSVNPDHQCLEKADGLCCYWRKEIIVSDCSDWDEKERKTYQKQILRHEIVHAFLFESGMAYNSSHSNAWAMNEEMVDWLAIQGPKLTDAWKKAGCL